jgi:nicotinate-nucleotide pyrophosphorylase (carboxylating)
VQEIAHTNAKIYDTRKTTPAFRELEKYAVRCGGGQNHRMRLDDMVLIKDNHITAAGGIAITVKKAREYLSSQPVFITGFNHEMPHQVREVMLEVDTLDQLQQAIMAQPDIILLDNFSLENLKKAVALVGGKIPLEASGGVNLQTVKAIAESGVDRISTSKITQSAPAVDIGLDEYF